MDGPLAGAQGGRSRDRARRPPRRVPTPVFPSPSLSHPFGEFPRRGDARAHLFEYVPAVPPQRLWDEEEAVGRADPGAASRHLSPPAGFRARDVLPETCWCGERARWRAKLADLGFTLLWRSGPRGCSRHPGVLGPGGGSGKGSPERRISTPRRHCVCLDRRPRALGGAFCEMLRALAAGPSVPRPRYESPRTRGDALRPGFADSAPNGGIGRNCGEKKPSGALPR
jgi:hypothetical protein